MKQYILKYKPNGAILGWYCTKEAAWDRMNYLTDTNFFGVFEVEVHLGCVGDHQIGVIIDSNDSVLNVYPNYDFITDTSTYLVDQEVCYITTIDYKIVGKELKQPKPEKEEDF